MNIRSSSETFAGGKNDLLILVENMAKRAKANPKKLDTHLPDAHNFPEWSDEIRCMPNEILRSALFNAKNRNQPRIYLKNQDIGVIGKSVRITYTGEELRQGDESVWLQLIHLAKSTSVGGVIEFTAYSMVQALRLTRSKPNPQHIKRLCESLRRMQATSLSVYSNRLGHGVSLSMIPKFEWRDEATGSRLPKWRVCVAPELIKLFGDVHYTHLEWAQRLALPSGIATWMHGYLASHRDPMPIKLCTLHKGAGCTTETPRKFKQLIASALVELQQVGFLKTWEIHGELVRVVRR